MGGSAGHGRPAHESGAGPDGDAGSDISGGSAHHGPHSGAGKRADGGTVSQVLIGHLVGRTAGLRLGPLAADGIISLKSLEVFSRSRPHHDTGTGGDTGAPQQERTDQDG
jgi:hypothetical protein